MIRRSLTLFAGLFVLFTVIGWFLGAANISLLLVQSFAYALIALGLNIQWGYAGLFNVGGMGFIALAAFASMLVSHPINWTFWEGDGPGLLGQALATLVLGIGAIWAASQAHRIGLPKSLRTLLTLIVVVYVLLQRAWHSPWGRMMRAIRDNETAAEAMGKDVNRRRLEMFVIGNFIIGVGGAALITFASIFDPSSFAPLNHTFLIWVMVILGGSGNNLGAIIGALLVYVIWTMSEPVTMLLFDQAAQLGGQLFGWEAPADLPTRALQMRVFLIGLTITLVLRYAPQGLLPERPVRYE